MLKVRNLFWMVVLVAIMLSGCGGSSGGSTSSGGSPTPPAPTTVSGSLAESAIIMYNFSDESGVTRGNIRVTSGSDAAIILTQIDTGLFVQLSGVTSGFAVGSESCLSSVDVTGTKNGHAVTGTISFSQCVFSAANISAVISIELSDGISSTIIVSGNPQVPVSPAELQTMVNELQIESPLVYSSSFTADGSVSFGSPITYEGSTRIQGANVGPFLNDLLSGNASLPPSNDFGASLITVSLVDSTSATITLATSFDGGLSSTLKVGEPNVSGLLQITCPLLITGVNTAQEIVFNDQTSFDLLNCDSQLTDASGKVIPIDNANITYRVTDVTAVPLVVYYAANSNHGYGYSGNLIADAESIAPSGTTFTNGIEAADYLCNNDPYKPTSPESAIYKAMIVDGVNRVACSSSNCETAGAAEHVNWVIEPGFPYSVGQESYTTASAIGLLDTQTQTSLFPVFGNSNLFYSWDGLNSDWTTNSNNCNSWSIAAANVSGAGGLLNAYLLSDGFQYGNNTESQFFGLAIPCNSTLTGNQSAGGLICVQQLESQ